ncbi:MAG: N-acetylmuramoyl-L-alanine amidase [Acidimicrobiia bacterium]|nr:N-acetylmuramoyl-L-alanine amidase [Acidimicrobiia bacterium]
MNRLTGTVAVAYCLIQILMSTAVVHAQESGAGGDAPIHQPDALGFVDGDTSQYLLPTPEGGLASLYFGVPGDEPFLGDWDCDGIDSPGLYRVGDGFVYLRNSNTIGTADVRFYMGEQGDRPLVGDFNGDGCDTISVYRPGTGQVFIANRLGSESRGVRADLEIFFGNPGDRPFAGDFNADGITDIGLHRDSSGLVYMRFDQTTGPAQASFFYGEADDQIFAGDWNGDGLESVGLYRSLDRSLLLSNENRLQQADVTYQFGEDDWIPVAGSVGDLTDLELVGPTDRPGVEVIAREGWGSAPIGQLEPHTIEEVTIHHSARSFAGSNSDAPARIRSYQRYHQDQGWPDIAYHFVIDRNGNVYQGRSPEGRGDTFTNYDPSGHFLVMVDGDFDGEPPTDAQIESLARMVAWGIDEWGIDPGDVGGHRDHAKTSCPGELLYGLIHDGTLAARTDELRRGGVALQILDGAGSLERVDQVEAGIDPDPGLVMLPVIPNLPAADVLARLAVCPGCAGG